MILPGDIIVIRGRGWLSDHIVAAEYGNNPPPFAVSHCGLFVTGDPKPVVVEALSHVMRNPLAVTVRNAAHAWQLQDKTLSDHERDVIVAMAASFTGDEYGYLDLLAQWLDGAFKNTWFTRQLGWYLKHHPICSYIPAVAYKAIGLNFGTPDSSCTPRNIMDFARMNTALYTVTELS